MKLYYKNSAESILHLPFDEDAPKKAIALKEQLVTPNLKYLIHVGIGGSSLGERAVYDAILGYFDGVTPDRFPKMVFLDTPDPEYLEKIAALLREVKDKQEVLVHAVSKSGTTLETAFNLAVLRHNFPHDDRLVVSTQEGSPLWREAKAKNISCLAVPANIPGRFAVFSAASLFSLFAAGLDIGGLLTGARAADVSDSASAALIYANYKSGKTILDIFLFHPELESLGKWYRQLLAESLGKEGKGVTPVVSIGTADLHSTLQLNLDGPRDKFTVFVSAKDSKTGKRDLPGEILAAVKKSYQENKLPFVEVVLPEVSEQTLGEFMQSKMGEVLHLGKLFGVNVFNQPAVESYKKRTAMSL